MTEKGKKSDAPHRTVRAPKRGVRKVPVRLPVSKATGGVRPGIDLNDMSSLQELEDLEYAERLLKGFQ